MKCPKCGYELPKAIMRSGQQNNLQWLWAKDAAEQLSEYSVEEEQRQCKFLYGLPILKRKEKFIDFLKKRDIAFKSELDYWIDKDVI